MLQIQGDEMNLAVIVSICAHKMQVYFGLVSLPSPQLSFVLLMNNTSRTSTGVPI